MSKFRKSSVVHIGNTPMGGENPIRIQSMTNTSTLDTEESIRQCIRIIEAGGEYVRLTAQGVREAENLLNIKVGLRKSGYQTPLVADIHFNPQAAYAAAAVVEKVRINPGNFVDPVKTFKTLEYSDEAYRQEIEKIRERFVPFLNICKEHHTAVRIGVNHGSLSDRIMSRFGDTPEGMVESCLEFLRICVDENFQDVVISIKASSTWVMVNTVRLLVERMDAEGMSFPLHLGVTEAGDGEDGRIKSAVGIGTLLLEGIGDTIRVSLSEDPEAEIPVARKLIDYIAEKSVVRHVDSAARYIDSAARHFEQSEKSNIPRSSYETKIPIVIADYSHATSCEIHPDLPPDFLYLGTNAGLSYPENQKVIVDFSSFSSRKNEFPLFTVHEFSNRLSAESALQFVAWDSDFFPDAGFFVALKRNPQTVVILSGSPASRPYGQKALIHRLRKENIENPVVIRQQYAENDLETFQLKSSVDCGSFFLDRLADGIFLQNTGEALSAAEINSCSFGILQATGRRFSKTEYISCPSCGRTLFDLQATLKKVKAATAHLKGLKIGIMGCIVNGPGEMADADFGYVGAGAGKISLYKRKECVKKNIPEPDEAEEKLKELLAIFREKKAALSAKAEKLKEDNLVIKKQIIEKLKHLIESKEDFYKVYNEFRKLQQQWKEVKQVPQAAINELWKDYQNYSEKFYDLLKINNEMRDYDFKKNMELKQTLCESVEKLDNEKDVVSAFYQLQKLHQEWREIGPVAREFREEIWSRFKNASSIINKRYQDHFESLRVLEQRNLEEKTGLCVEMESIDYSKLTTFKEWDEFNKKVLEFQDKWKTIGFAPKKSNVKIFERFRTACDVFFRAKNDFYKGVKGNMDVNLEKKKALCEKVESLKDSQDWKETTDQLIALQKEWKSIGPASRKYSDAVWKRFISACDYFFEQKNNHFSSQKTEEVDNLKKKKAIIEKITSIDISLPVTEAIAIIRELMSDWNKIGFVPFREKDKIYKEYQTAIDKHFDRLKIDKSERRLQSFKSNLNDISAGGEKSKNKLLGEREKLMRTYERLKNDIQTYENNIGFLSVSSKGGGGLVKEMNRKIESLKEELDLIVKKIEVIDENFENK